MNNGLHNSGIDKALAHLTDDASFIILFKTNKTFLYKKNKYMSFKNKL